MFHEDAGAGGGIPGAETAVAVQGGMGRWTGGGNGLLIVCASLACRKSHGGVESVDVVALFLQCVVDGDMGKQKKLGKLWEDRKAARKTHMKVSDVVPLLACM